MINKFCIKNKVCIVTGAAGGIGRRIAETFSAAGCVVYAVDIQREKLDEWVIEWNSSNKNHKIYPVIVDLCDSKLLREMIMDIYKIHKKIDILINNAAVISYEFLSMVSIEKMKTMFQVNVFSLIEMMQYASRVMTKSRSGCIINIASMVGVKGVIGQFSYSVSKGAVVTATKSAAKELAQDNIRVNAVAPGMVGTERFNKVMSENFSSKQSDIPMGRIAKEEEIANLCLFLASDEASYITGQIVGIDGGIII